MLWIDVADDIFSYASVPRFFYGGGDSKPIVEA